MDPRVTTFIVMAVLVACFSVLLPNVLWPMFRSVFIWEKPQPQHDPRGPGPSRPGGPGGGFAPGMRPNPGSQGQAPRPQQGSPSPGGGKGGYLGLILPLYAVGISLYLIFTLFKIFVGGGNGGDQQSAIARNLNPAGQAELSHSIQEVDRFLRMTDGADPSQRGRAGATDDSSVSQRTRLDFETEAAAADAETSVIRQQEEERRRRRDEEERRLRVAEMLYGLKQDADSQGEELREHLSKAKGDSEDSALQEKELKHLESRLQRTENAMAQILKAMGHIPDNLGLGDGDDGGDEEDEGEEIEADTMPHSQQQHSQQQLPHPQPNSDKKLVDIQNISPSISLKLPASTLTSNTDSSDASSKAFTAQAANASSSENASGSAAINASDSVAFTFAASTSDAASVPKVVSIRAFERNLEHKEKPAMTIEVSEKCQTETARVDDDDDADSVEDEGRKNRAGEVNSTKAPDAPIPNKNIEEKKSEVLKSPNADSLSETVERRTQSVQRRRPASRSTSLLSQASPDRDSLDDDTASAWESIWPDYSTTNVEAVGLGIDAEQLRARVLRGVDEEDDGKEPEEETPAANEKPLSADQQSSMGVDFDQLRARVLQGNASLGKTSVQVSDIGIKDINGDGLHPDNDDDDEDVDEDEDLYEHDSVEMEDGERKEVDMVDSLLEDDFGFAEEKETNSKTELFLHKENSPVLRTSFTPEEVQNLRQRVGRLE